MSSSAHKSRSLLEANSGLQCLSSNGSLCQNVALILAPLKSVESLAWYIEFLLQ